MNLWIFIYFLYTILNEFTELLCTFSKKILNLQNFYFFYTILNEFIFIIIAVMIRAVAGPMEAQIQKKL